MQGGHKVGLATGLLADGPAGQQHGGLRDVLLGIAGLYTQGVQLQQFAREILIQAFFSPRPSPGGWPHGLRVVQVQQHGRVQGGRAQQFFEIAKGVRTDRLVLMRPHQCQHGALGGRHAEVVGPELHPALGHRRRGFNGVLPAPGQPLEIGLPQVLARGRHRAQLVLGHRGTFGRLGTQRGPEHLAGEQQGLHAVDQSTGVKSAWVLKLFQNPGTGIGTQRCQAGLGKAEPVGGDGGGLHAMSTRFTGVKLQPMQNTLNLLPSKS